MEVTRKVEGKFLKYFSELSLYFLENEESENQDS